MLKLGLICQHVLWFIRNWLAKIKFQLSLAASVAVMDQTCVCAQGIQEMLYYTFMQWCMLLQTNLSCMNDKNYEKKLTERGNLV